MRRSAEGCALERVAGIVQPIRRVSPRLRSRQTGCGRTDHSGSTSATRWMSRAVGQSAARARGPASTPGQPSPPGPRSPRCPIERPAIAGRRVVQAFRLRRETVRRLRPYPMYWKQHEESGFPLYLEGQFDPKVGHDAAPSFRWISMAAPFGFHYVGRDISVRTNSDYLVVAWCKATPLKTARVYIGARYLDRKGVPIEGTERRSELHGGPDASQDWVPLTVGLPGNVPDTRYIGVSVWLTQAAVWDTSPRAMRNRWNSRTSRQTRGSMTSQSIACPG